MPKHVTSPSFQNADVLLRQLEGQRAQGGGVDEGTLAAFEQAVSELQPYEATTLLTRMTDRQRQMTASGKQASPTAAEWQIVQRRASEVINLDWAATDRGPMPSV